MQRVFDGMRAGVGGVAAVAKTACPFSFVLEFFSVLFCFSSKFFCFLFCICIADEKFICYVGTIEGGNEVKIHVLRRQKCSGFPNPYLPFYKENYAFFQHLFSSRGSPRVAVFIVLC